MSAVSARSLLRFSLVAVALCLSAFNLSALDAAKSETPKPGEPTDPKARKTYQTAVDWLKAGHRDEAIDSFRKAARQDGHCSECLKRAFNLASALGKYKDAEELAASGYPSLPPISIAPSLTTALPCLFNSRESTTRRRSASTKAAMN